MTCECVRLDGKIGGGEKLSCSDCSRFPLGKRTTEQTSAVNFWTPGNGVELRLPYPVSANRYWRHFRGRVVRSAAANAYRAQVVRIALAAGVEPFSGAVSLGIHLLPKLTKKGLASGTCIDLSNAWKVAEDALQGIAYDNDRQVRGFGALFGDPVEDGGLVVVIKAFDS
ncbi:Crossover junction endodeoxyribonuclease, RusA-like [uncultured Caudovirales phage]|uniref:Crossover junction endodeoxyribonuclease, RusA-like n=1 Tax=uncultured Caudovirales phage TaxID=2100421 RepID=A0A6J7WH52_9CAUD|nr:Crossover junction endodeoxyribonuclease, RusA-like [uncultured Caudovirales phage]